MRITWRILVLTLFAPFLMVFSGFGVNANIPSHERAVGKDEEKSITPLPSKILDDQVSQLIQGPPAPTEKSKPPIRLSIPAEAVLVAQADAIVVKEKDPFALPFTRWIWVQSGEEKDFKALSATLQKISRSEVPIKPVTHGIIARIDLRWFAGSEKDLQDWIDLWENLQFDPWFSFLITKDTLKLLSEDFKQNTTVQVWKPKKVWNKEKEVWDVVGKTLTDVKVSALKDIIVVRGNAEHLRSSGIEKLQLGCQTIAPIVDSRYFTGRVLTTIKGKINGKESLYSTVWGGLYYEFSGIRKVVTKGIKTDLDQLLFDLGVGSKDENYEQLFERLRGGLEAAALFRSNVTGKRRKIVWFPIEKMRLTQGVPAIFITEDLKDEDVDIDADPIMNLVKFKADAYEVIFTKSNGHQGYAIFNGAGELLDEATQDVVTDHRIPAPHTARLQSAISCIRCHGTDDGWKPFTNDVKTLLSRRKGKLDVDVFGDTSKGELNKPVSDTILKLAGKYEGDATLLLMRLRSDYAKAMLRSTGSWDNDPGQLNTVKLASEQIVKVYAEDRYDQIDAELALRYLGYPPPPKGKEIEILNKALPPVKLNIGGIVPEDPRIAALKEGIKINPKDWALIYSFALTRAIQSAEQASKEDKK